MATPSDLNLRISVLLPAMRDFESILPALEAWDRQTRRDQLEILILCPEGLGPSEAQSRALAANHVIVHVGRAQLHEARALGVAHATGDYLMLAEDHCLPDPGWSEAVLARIAEGWDAVACALRPGNRTTLWALGSFLLGYGEWMIPVAGGPVGVLCGWNGTLRLSMLREFSGQLADELLVGAFFVRRLKEQGHRFYLENRARMRHFDPTNWAYELFLLLIVGCGFGAKRTRSWSWSGRLLYPLAAPAIALLHFRRAFRQYRRAGAACGLPPTVLLPAFLLATMWGLGEGIGALLGVRHVEPFLWRTEVKPVRREDVERSAAIEQSLNIPA